MVIIFIFCIEDDRIEEHIIKVIHFKKMGRNLTYSSFHLMACTYIITLSNKKCIKYIEYIE